MRRQPSDRAPPVGIAEALSEKAFNAERAISTVRLLVVGANSLIYIALTEKSGTIPWLAYSVIALAGIYSVYEYFFEPYRRYAVFLSAYFSAVTDAALIIVWLYATGGFHSSFYVLLYPAMVSVAFRFTAKETAFAALVYSGGYVALLLALGQASGHEQQIVVRITYVFLTAILGHLISREVLEQTQRKISYKEHMTAVVREIAERKRAEQTALDLMREQTRRTIAEEAEQRSTFLAEASRILGASLDHETGLRQLAGLVVPTFADACAIDLIEADGSLKRVTDCRADDVMPQVDTSGSDSKQGASFLTLAMTTQRVHGVITFAMGRSGREFDQAKIAVAEELSRRAAIAVEHSRLFLEAQEAIRARDDFLSVASHELNTPLTALQLQIELLHQQTARAGKLPKRVELARRHVMRLTKLIRNLLDVSRISSGKLALELEDVDLCAVVRDAAERTEEIRRSAGSSLHVSTPGTLIGRWDRLRVEQVVVNLLTNAIKYGEGRRIEVSVENASEVARLTVRDFGMGIPLEEQARIFERFGRANSAHRYVGFGLGLWIVRQVVTALGGAIELDSRPGEGSTFTVELPIYEPQSRAPTAAAQAQ